MRASAACCDRPAGHPPAASSSFCRYSSRYIRISSKK
jgi:hypothetical protein